MRILPEGHTVSFLEICSLFELKKEYQCLILSSFGLWPEYEMLSIQCNVIHEGQVIGLVKWFSNIQLKKSTNNIFCI